MNIMSELIEQADKDRRVVNGRPYYCSSAIAEHAIGKITCSRNYCTAGVINARHVRTTWELNGKRISASTLVSLISA